MEFTLVDKITDLIPRPVVQAPIYLNEDNTVWLADSKTGLLHLIDLEKRLVETIGSTHSSNLSGPFGPIRGLYAEGDLVYVTAEGRDIKVISKGGAFMDSFPGMFNANSQIGPIVKICDRLLGATYNFPVIVEWNGYSYSKKKDLYEDIPKLIRIDSKDVIKYMCSYNDQIAVLTKNVNDQARILVYDSNFTLLHELKTPKSQGMLCTFGGQLYTVVRDGFASANFEDSSINVVLPFQQGNDMICGIAAYNNHLVVGISDYSADTFRFEIYSKN